MEIKNNLKNVLSNYNLQLNDNILNNLSKFNCLMLDYNKKHNLTSITDEFNVIYKHYLDSLLGYNSIKANYKQEQYKIIDIGAGAGFPSVPLCIYDENLNITALDSVKKKTNFIEIAKNELKLNNLSIINARIEEIAHKEGFRESFDIVISRAVASLSTLLEYSAPLLKVGGKIIAYKGQNYLDELETCKKALKLLSCELDTIEEFNIKEIDAKRYILIFSKKDKTANKYPRGQNKPRLSPL